MDIRRIEHDNDQVRYFYKKINGYYNETAEGITRYGSMQGYSANFELQNELRHSWLPDFNLHVMDYFNQYHSQALRVEFLRSAFGNRQRDFEGIFFDQCRLISAENGLRLQNFTKEFEASWDWKEVEHRINIMISDNRFLDYDDQAAFRRLEEKGYNFAKLTEGDRYLFGKDTHRPRPYPYSEERESIRKKLKVAEKNPGKNVAEKEALKKNNPVKKKGEPSL